MIERAVSWLYTCWLELKLAWLTIKLVRRNWELKKLRNEIMHLNKGTAHYRFHAGKNFPDWELSE